MWGPTKNLTEWGVDVIFNFYKKEAKSLVRKDFFENDIDIVFALFIPNSRGGTGVASRYANVNEIYEYIMPNDGQYFYDL